MVCLCLSSGSCDREELCSWVEPWSASSECAMVRKAFFDEKRRYSRAKALVQLGKNRRSNPIFFTFEILNS